MTFAVSVLAIQANDMENEKVVCKFDQTSKAVGWISILAAVGTLGFLGYLAFRVKAAKGISTTIQNQPINYTKDCEWCDDISFKAGVFMFTAAVSSLVLSGLLLSVADDPSKADEDSFRHTSLTFASLGIIASVIIAVVVLMRLHCAVYPKWSACSRFMNKEAYKTMVSDRQSILQAGLAEMKA